MLITKNIYDINDYFHNISYISNNIYNNLYYIV